MGKQFIVLIMVLCSSLKLTAGDKIKFGRVSKEELQETSYAKYPDANAAYLYKNRKTYFEIVPNQGLVLVTELHHRIKIYKKDGLSYATQTIDVSKSGSTEEELMGLRGYTYNLVDGKVVETKLSKKSIFKTEVSKYKDQVKLSFPEVKEGTIVEFKYKLVSPFVQYIDEFIFQEDIPTKRLDAKMKIWDYFKYSERYKGKSFGAAVKGSFDDLDIGARTSTISYNLTDVPALKEESFVSNINNFRSAVKFEIKSVEIPGRLHENYSRTWEGVAKGIYSNSGFGKQISSSNYYSDELNAVLANAATEEDKIMSVFHFAMSKVKWDGYYGVHTDKGVRRAYKEGTGNVAEVNLMLVSMLKYAGLRAYPVLVSTRNHGVPLFPTKQGFNYVVAAVKYKEDYLLLDATSPASAPNILPFRALNWYGRIITENGNSTAIQLMPRQQAQDVVMMNVDLNEDGSINGQLREQYTAHNAMSFRVKYFKSNEETFLENLEKQYGSLEISDYKLSNAKKPTKPIVQTYKFKLEDQMDQVGGKILIEPLFQFTNHTNPFKSETRDFPVDYGYAWQDKYIVNIKVPEGYKVESLPKSVAMSLPDGMGTFKYQVSQLGNTVKVMSLLEINTPIIKADYYKGLKEFYRNVVEKQTEKVVLTR